ncbi:hypothetical protein HII08_004331 [Escherichia coli]|nr:hypothetical protein [Escherichia coli]
MFKCHYSSPFRDFPQQCGPQSGYTENQKRRTAARKTKKAAQLRSLINPG